MIFAAQIRFGKEHTAGLPLEARFNQSETLDTFRSMEVRWGLLLMSTINASPGAKATRLDRKVSEIVIDWT